jgi:predicted urease superfamily metal-dependent hydrolase
VRSVQMMRGRSIPALMLIGLATLWFPFVLDENMARAAEPSSASLQEQADGLMKNVEEMVAHGGMGDAKAIIHHCGEAKRFAETIIKQIPASDSHRTDAITSLNEVIRQCNRVSDIGIHADPGQLLNPATKARAAAQQSIKLLGLTKTNKS